MPPVGLLAIVALGLVLAYVLPQRIRERGDYAMVRTEDRFSAEMRVVRASAERVVPAAAPAAKPASDAARPLLVTGEARASVAAVGEAHMSRPSAPLDRAATVARREASAMRRDRAAILQRRANQARRRGTVATIAFLGAAVAWTLVALQGAPVWPAVVASTAFGGVTVAGRRAVAAQASADATLVPVAREVMTAEAATRALQRISAGRSAGGAGTVSRAETEAIRVVTADDLAPGAIPASVPAPELPEIERDGWTPSAVPPPAYTLKATAERRTPRAITEDDLAASTRTAARVADERDAQEKRRRAEAEEAAPSTAALDAILARRRMQSA